MFWGGNDDPNNTNNSQMPFSLLETCPQTIQFNYPKAKGGWQIRIRIQIQRQFPKCRHSQITVEPQSPFQSGEPPPGDGDTCKTAATANLIIYHLAARQQQKII